MSINTADLAQELLETYRLHTNENKTYHLLSAHDIAYLISFEHPQIASWGAVNNKEDSIQLEGFDGSTFVFTLHREEDDNKVSVNGYSYAHVDNDGITVREDGSDINTADDVKSLIEIIVCWADGETND